MFNAQEKQQIVNLVRNVIKPVHATLINELSISIQQNQDTSAILIPAIVAVKEASREASLAFTFLMGGNGDASFAAPKPTRPVCLTSAWFHLDRVTMFCNQAITALAASSGPNALRAKTIWLPQAIAGVKTVDRTLAYLDPLPSPDGKMVGPHGDYLQASWHCWRAWWYLLDMFEFALGLYGDPGVDWYAVVNKTPFMFGMFARGLARFADIDTEDKELSVRASITNPAGIPFWMLLGYGQAMTDYQVQGIPEYYHELQVALASGSTSFGATRIRISDSWRHLDKSVWHCLLDFPGCNLIDDPEGCAKKLPSQQPVVQKVLPDSITATVGSTTATYVLKV